MSPSILIAVCSKSTNRVQRQAVRVSWGAGLPQGILLRFFTGIDTGHGAQDEEADLLRLEVRDEYEYLPSKVMAFLRHAYESFEWDWVYKCDDDTYLAADRLSALCREDVELVGNEFLDRRGSPSGGAGYLLSRPLVARILKENQVPLIGNEDVEIGNAALRVGAVYSSTKRLCWNLSRQPRPENKVVSCHWVSPQLMRAIHARLRLRPIESYSVHHKSWCDSVSVFPGGYYGRSRTTCMGRWIEGANGSRTLDWFQWKKEQVMPTAWGYLGARMRLVRIDSDCLPLTEELTRGLNFP